MPYTNAEKDFDRAQELKSRAKRVGDAAAKRSLLDAATRLERRGAKKASQLGKPRRKVGTRRVG